MKKKSRAKKKSTPSFRKIFDNPAVPYFGLLNNILALVTLVAIAVVALETVASFERYQLVFITLEYIAVFIFSMEYLARVYLAQNK